MTKQTKAVGALIDQLYTLRADIRELNNTVNTLKQQKDELELKLIEMLDALGTDQSRSDLATATITETVVPNVEDWEAFYRYVSREKAFFLLERRVSSTAYRDTLQARKGRKLPGVESFTKRTLSLRTRS